jgi:hypothetical protein
MSLLVLNRGSASRSSGQWRDDDYDVLENGVRRIDRGCCGAAATAGTSSGRGHDPGVLPGG